MDNNYYNSYGPTDYQDDKDKKYDSYGYSDYGMDSGYDDRKSYDNSYKSQYQSYKQDYKPQYTSYDGKDDKRDKSSKDSSKSVNINKIKCINDNLNINGNNTADINVGNKGQGYSGAYSSGLNGEEYNGYYDGYEKKGKGFDDCIIDNNNNNTNINLGVGGNQTTPEDLACEECFAANSTLQTAILDFLVDFNEITIDASSFGIFVLGPGTDTIEQLCDMIESSASLYGVPMSDAVLKFEFSRILGVDPFTPNSGIDALIECLLEAGVIVHRELPPPPPMSISDYGIAGVNIECTGDPLCESLLQARLTNSNSLGSSTAPNINTDTSEFQGTADSHITSQGTEEDSSALEKMTKLKQQWLELLP